MRVQPLGDRVVVKPKPKEEKSKGGIYLPYTTCRHGLLSLSSVESGRRSPAHMARNSRAT